MPAGADSGSLLGPFCQVRVLKNALKRPSGAETVSKGRKIYSTGGGLVHGATPWHAGNLRFEKVYRVFSPRKNLTYLCSFCPFLSKSGFLDSETPFSGRVTCISFEILLMYIFMVKNERPIKILCVLIVTLKVIKVVFHLQSCAGKNVGEICSTDWTGGHTVSRT